MTAKVDNNSKIPQTSKIVRRDTSQVGSKSLQGRKLSCCERMADFFKSIIQKIKSIFSRSSVKADQTSPITQARQLRVKAYVPEKSIIDSKIVKDFPQNVDKDSKLLASMLEQIEKGNFFNGLDALSEEITSSKILFVKNQWILKFLLSLDESIEKHKDKALSDKLKALINQNQLELKICFRGYHAKAHNDPALKLEYAKIRQFLESKHNINGLPVNVLDAMLPSQILSGNDKMCLALNTDAAEIVPPYGFPNPTTENACWIISTMQAFLNTPFLRERMAEAAERKDAPETIKFLKKFLTCDKDEIDWKTLEEFRAMLYDPVKAGTLNLFTPHEKRGVKIQQDAPEFVSYLLENFKYQIPINKYRKFKNRTIEHRDAEPKTCINLRLVSEKDPKKTSYNLVELLERHFDYQPDDEPVKNMVEGKIVSMKKGDAGESRIKITSKPPEVVIFQFDRWIPTGGRAIRNSKEILLPPGGIVDLKSAFHLPYSEGTKYQITSIISQLGEEMENGHYTAEIYRDGKWFSCDDDKVKPIEPPSTLTKGYLLVLERCDEE